MLIRYTSSFLRHLRYYRLFSGECYGCFKGVYNSFEEAVQSAPKTKKIGYDHDSLAEWYAKELDETVKDYDYPVLFWLEKLLTEQSTLFDFGGNVGTHYYQYRGYLKLKETVKWIVLDLPEIVKAGKKYRQEPNLFFTDNLEETQNADIMLASGVVQYIDDFSVFINSLHFTPRHLLINRIPLYDGERFVTLQNGGEVFYPQYVFNRKEFIATVEQAGYELKDEWVDRMDGCFIPFNPKNSLPNYTGLYFELKST